MPGNVSSRVLRRSVPWLPALALAGLALGCSEEPAGPELSETAITHAKGGPPVRCNAAANLSITLVDAAGNSLQSDGGGPYVEDGVLSAHINDPTGRLMLATNAGSGRFVNVTTSFNGGTTFPTIDRIYTNGHDTGDGIEDACGLIDVPAGGAGVAVFEAELTDAAGVDDGRVRFGRDCAGAPVVNERVDITRSADGNTWTISGTSGIHCRQPEGQKKPGFAQVGTAGPFSMTLVKIGA